MADLQEAAVGRLGPSEVHHEAAENSRAVDGETSHREAAETSREVVVVPVVTSLHGEEPVESLFPEVGVSHHEDEGDLPHVDVETLHQEAAETLRLGAVGISHQGVAVTSHRGAVATSRRGAVEISHLVEGAISMLLVEVALLEDRLQLVGRLCVEGLH